MVLSRRSPSFLTLGLLAVVAWSGCVTRRPVQRLAQEAPVALALAVDEDRGSTVAAPDFVRSEVESALSKRNLRSAGNPDAALVDAYSRVRLSPARFEALRKQVPDSTYAVLGEMKVEYFSLNSGRYRWVVYAKLTAARTAGGESVSRDFEFPVFLNFAYERNKEALNAAADSIASAAGTLVDDLLAMPVDPPGNVNPKTPSSASLLPTQPTFAPDTAPGAPAFGQVVLASAEGGQASSAGNFSHRPLPAPAGDAVYFVMVDRFSNGKTSNDAEVKPSDPAAFHGGDLDGVTAKVDHLYDLGVRTVWLSPVFAGRTTKFFGNGAFHGYWVEDLSRVEPRFGDEAALRRLSDTLHARGMRLVLDMVLNHVGPDAPLSKAKPEWFHRKGPIQDWNDPKQLEEHDVHGLPDFDTSREDVYAYLRDTSLDWIPRANLDGFRLDAVKHLPSTFWSRYAQDVKRAAGPDFWLLGEMLDGDARNVSRMQADGRFDSMFDFPLRFALIDVFCKGMGPARLGAVLTQDRFYEDPRSLVTMLDNHDLPRILSECGGDARKVSQALAVMLSARGTPSFTYGFEAGLQGKGEPENRGDMVFDAKHPLYAAMRDGLTLRRDHPVLQTGGSRILTADEKLFAYVRASADEAALVLVNRDAKPRQVSVPSALASLPRSDGSRGATVEVPADAVKVVFLTPAKKGALESYAQSLERERKAGEARRSVEVELPRGGKGGTLYLVGSGPEFGDWKPEKGVPLSGKKGKRLSLPVGSVLEYKLVERRSGASPKWEEGENRVLFVGEGKGPLKLQVKPRTGGSNR